MSTEIIISIVSVIIGLAITIAIVVSIKNEINDVEVRQQIYRFLEARDFTSIKTTIRQFSSLGFQEFSVEIQEYKVYDTYTHLVLTTIVRDEQIRRISKK